MDPRMRRSWWGRVWGAVPQGGGGASRAERKAVIVGGTGRGGRRGVRPWGGAPQPGPQGSGGGGPTPPKRAPDPPPSPAKPTKNPPATAKQQNKKQPPT